MRFLIHFCIATILLAAALAGFNYGVDPYAIYHEKTEGAVRVMNERIFKTVKLSRTPADVVFMGTSRTDIGIGREQPALSGKKLLNLATFGQPIRETRRLFELAVAEGKPGAVVIGLDFFAFNALFAPPSDYVEENYSDLRKISLLLSVSTLSDSLSKYRHPLPVTGDCCFADGFRIATDPAYLTGKYHHYFAASERMYLMEKYLPYPQCAFSFAPAGHEDLSSLADLRAIFELAQRQRIDLRLFISPSHARQWETLAISGLWDKWEAWKRQIVALNESAAEQAGQSPFSLWDFSGYDAVSSEDLPDEGEQKLMRGYSDSSHYVPALGQRLVARLFGAKDEWGTMLNSSNVEGNLARIRVARQLYRNAHVSDVAEIEALARETQKAKHCPGSSL